MYERMTLIRFNNAKIKRSSRFWPSWRFKIDLLDNLIIINNSGSTNGKPKTTISTELLLAFEAMPEISVKIAAKPEHPKVNVVRKSW